MVTPDPLDFDASELDSWANKPDASHRFPQLIRRLIFATIKNPSFVHFPSGSSVWLPGLDGLVSVEKGNAWVPSGNSAWEVSCEKKPSDKATTVYNTRTEWLEDEDQLSTTFVFATPRRWSGKIGWANKHQKKGQWANVRALDADDLVAWLEQDPGVAVWFAKLIGKFPPFAQEFDALAQHGTDLHRETRNEITEHIHAEFLDLKSDLKSSITQTTALMPQSPPQEPDLDAARKALKEKIDLTREFINHELFSKAKSELERLMSEVESIPDDLKFRIFTNLGACHLAEEDVGKARNLLDEAYNLEPANPLAIANAAWIAQLSNEPERAKVLAIEARKLDCRNSHATGALIEGLWDSGAHEELEGLLAAEPWIVEDQRCGLMLARIRLQQHRYEGAKRICTSLIAAEPDNARSHLVLSKILLEHAQSERLPPQPDKGFIELLRKANSEATEAIELLQMTELRALRQEALVTRAATLAELGDFEKALIDLDRVLGENPTHTEASFIKGQILLQINRPQEARLAFEAIQDSERHADSLLQLAVSCLESGDETTTIKLLQGTITFKSLEWEEIRKAEILSRAETLANVEDSIGSVFEDALIQHSENTPLLAFKAARFDNAGNSEEAEALLIKTLDQADASDRKHVLIRLAILYQRLHRYVEAADRFIEVVEGNALHPAAISLLECLVNSKRLREAMNWVRTIRAIHPEPPRTALDVEAQILEHVGDLKGALVCRTELCSRQNATSNDRAKLGLTTFRLGQVDSALDIIHGIEPKDLSNTPLLILAIAQLKRLVGEDDYLEYAFTARRFGLSKPEIQLGYFHLFLGRGKEWVEPEVVESSCAVLLKNEDTEQWWQILEDGEDYGGPYELRITDELAQLLLGRCVGETIVLKDGIEELSYEVADIQSKFLRAWQETIAEFSTRFPESRDLLRVKIEGNDITKVLLTLDQRDQLVQRAENAYREGKLPFSSFASLLGRSVPEVWRACTAGELSRINFGRGTINEEKEANRAMREAGGIVLDLVAVLTVYELGITPYLRDSFSYVAVPQLVIDYLHGVYAKTILEPAPASWFGKGPNGVYSYCEMNEDNWLEWKKYIHSLFEFAMSFDKTASNMALDADDVEMLEDIFTTSGMAAIYAGEEGVDANWILVSDDAVMSSLARSKNIAVVNTQGLLQELRRSDVISDNEYSAGVEQLALLNYWFVRVLPADIIRRLEVNSYITTQGTRALFRTLEGPHCTDDSALSVATNIVVTLAESIPSHQMDIILSIVISTLRHGRESSSILFKFRNELASRLALAPFVREQVLQVVDGYIHFMDMYDQG